MTEDDPACCAVGRDRPARDDTYRDGDANHEGVPGPEFRTDPADPDDERAKGMTRIEGGTFRMGTDDDVGYPEDGEGPARAVTLDPFHVDRYAVTNAQFLAFVRETGYATDAERFGWSFVFRDFVSGDDREHVRGSAEGAPWWLAVEGANWLRPRGPGSNVIDDGLLKHPVTHVSWRDARAYADWADKRLPTEAEWERAARGCREGTRFPWGDELVPGGEHRCNVWQGEFPERNTVADGYAGTAPVDAFESNGDGLYNVCGNVWEWCADWFSPDYHATEAYDPTNPTGPPEGEARVMRGGSYLCHESWCNRYRLAARSKNTPASTTGNLGFRCVVDAK